MWPSSLPTVAGGFGVVIADPPWRFATYSAKGRDRCPDSPRLIRADGYRTLSVADIASLPPHPGGRPWRCRCCWWLDDVDPLDPRQPWPSAEGDAS
jgi:hypothetical protein